MLTSLSLSLPQSPHSESARLLHRIAAGPSQSGSLDQPTLEFFLLIFLNLFPYRKDIQALEQGLNSNSTTYSLYDVG